MGFEVKLQVTSLKPEKRRLATYHWFLAGCHPACWWAGYVSQL